MSMKCKDCGNEVSMAYVISQPSDKERIYQCMDCHYKEEVEKYPAPPIEQLEIGEDGRRQWPHNYIPRECPYCNGEIIAGYIGSYRDHVCHSHYCEECNIYFGWTD